MSVRSILDRLLNGEPAWDHSEGGFVGAANKRVGHSWAKLNTALDFGMSTGPDTDVAVGENLMRAAAAEYGELHDLYPKEPIDSRILAMMRAVEWFATRRGDVWQIMTAPLDIGLQPPVIMHRDPAVKKLFNEEYERLGVQDIAVLRLADDHRRRLSVAPPTMTASKRRPQEASASSKARGACPPALG